MKVTVPRMAMMVSSCWRTLAVRFWSFFASQVLLVQPAMMANGRWQMDTASISKSSLKGLEPPKTSKKNPAQKRRVHHVHIFEVVFTYSRFYSGQFSYQRIVDLQSWATTLWPWNPILNDKQRVGSHQPALEFDFCFTVLHIFRWLQCLTLCQYSRCW